MAVAGAASHSANSQMESKKKNGNVSEQQIKILNQRQALSLY